MTLRLRNFTSVFAFRPSFREKGPHLRFQFCNFTVYSSFWHSTISRERVASEDAKLQVYFSFWCSTFISCERVASLDLSIWQFYIVDIKFVQKGCVWSFDNAIFTPVLDNRPSFRSKWRCRRPQNWHFTVRSCFTTQEVAKPSKMRFTTRLCVPHARSPQRADTHDLRRRSRFDGHDRTAPAALRENLEEPEK